ncbi:hypothetical protein ABIA03_004011 [Bradyrhizobium yuanmingense]|uniref:Uncharacterized protein n=1 Tax=Bradyrhizobium yuanmingense TaxID=108015 RepID=A0ABV4GEH4_9BRAD
MRRPPKRLSPKVAQRCDCYSLSSLPRGKHSAAPVSVLREIWPRTTPHSLFLIYIYVLYGVHDFGGRKQFGPYPSRGRRPPPDPGEPFRRDAGDNVGEVLCSSLRPFLDPDVPQQPSVVHCVLHGCPANAGAIADLVNRKLADPLPLDSAGNDAQHSALSFGVVVAKCVWESARPTFSCGDAAWFAAHLSAACDKGAGQIATEPGRSSSRSQLHLRGSLHAEAGASQWPRLERRVLVTDRPKLKRCQTDRLRLSSWSGDSAALISL